MFFRSTIVVLVSTLFSGCAYSKNMGPSAKSPYSFAIYALSRGTGVPEATRNVFNRLRDKLERAERNGNAMNIKQSRIGIEGETRLCVEFQDTQFGTAMALQIRDSIRNVDLLNIKIERCLCTPPT